MMDALISLRDDVRGTSSVEYGIICGLIVIAMLVALNGFATGTSDMWSNVSTKTQTAMSGGA